MIVDFQHHFTPRQLIKEDPGDRLILHYDETGAPSYTIHSLLYDLDEHIRMMDLAGIDAAFLTSAAVDLVRRRASGTTHVPPLDPLKSLIDDFLRRGGTIWAYPPCVKARGYTQEDFIEGVTIVGSSAMHERLMAVAATLSF